MIDFQLFPNEQLSLGYKTLNQTIKYYFTFMPNTNTRVFHYSQTYLICFISLLPGREI